MALFYEAKISSNLSCLDVSRHFLYRGVILV
jgi:hypothetical protein